MKFAKKHLMWIWKKRHSTYNEVKKRFRKTEVKCKHKIETVQLLNNDLNICFRKSRGGYLESLSNITI